MRRTLCFILTIAVVLLGAACQSVSTSGETVQTSVAAGATTTKTPDSSTTKATEVGENVVITAAIADHTNIEDFNTNEVTLWIEEQLNVDLEFTVYESSDFNNKINLKVMGGDPLEDIVFGGFTDGVVFSWANEGVLAPITNFFTNAETAPGIFDAMERTGVDFRSSITMPDGEIYYVPVFNQSYGNEYFSKAWYYKDWLDEVGMDVPATTDDLHELLLAVAQTDLNSNNVKDEIGLAGFGGIYSDWFTWLMNSFVYTDTNNYFIKIENEAAMFSFLEDEWREGIEYIKMLVDDGCIPTETVTQDFETWKTMVNSVDHSSFILAYATPSPINDTDIKGSYLVLPPLKGPKGIQHAQYNPSKPSCGMIISAECENVDLAFLVGDLCVTEENSIVTRFGAREQDWDYVADLSNQEDFATPYEGFDPLIVVYDDARFWGSGEMQNRSWLQRGPFIRQYGIANGMAVDPKTVSEFSKNEAAGIVLYQKGDYSPKEVIVKLLYTSEEDKVIADVSSNLQSYIEETMSNWILGNSDLNDSSWEEFKATIETLQANDLLQAVQAAYTRSITN